VIRRPLFVCSVLFLAVGLMLGAGCSKKRPAEPAAPVVVTPVERAPEPAPAAEVQPAPARVELEDLFFDYDKYALRSDAREILGRNAQTLMAHPEVRVLIEGHCDERGTIEYNLALGDRRASAAKDFLVNFGINAARLETISYGEERPFSRGQDEAAWALNRRAHFVIR